MATKTLFTGLINTEECGERGFNCCDCGGGGCGCGYCWSCNACEACRNNTGTCELLDET